MIQGNFRKFLISLLFVATFVANADPIKINFAQPSQEALSQDFEQLEQETQQALSKNAEAGKNALLQLAQKYLVANRFQEAIWTFRRAGADEEAQSIEDQLRSYLTSTPLENLLVALPGAGAAQGKLAHFPIGISGVLKLDVGDHHPNYRTEIVAYELDRLLGLDVVPMTVPVKVGGQVGSLQYFIKDAKTANHLNQGGAGGGDRFPAGTFVDGYERMNLIDYLLANIDRHGANWLRRPGGHVVAIDHGHCDYKALILQEPFISQSRALLQFPRIMERLMSFTANDMKEKLDNLISDERLSNILSNREQLRLHVADGQIIREAGPEKIDSMLKSKIEALGPANHEKKQGYMSENGKSLESWLKSIVAINPNRNAIILIFMDALESTHAAGKISGRDYRRLLARAMGFAELNGVFKEGFAHLYSKSAPLREVLKTHRGVFVESKKEDAVAIKSAYEFVVAQFDEEDCLQKVAI